MFSILPLTFLICELRATFAGPENSPDEDMSTSTLSLCVSHTYAAMIDFNDFKVHSQQGPPPLPECSDHLCCPSPCVYQPSLSIDLPAITCPSSPRHRRHLVTTPWLVEGAYRRWLFSVYRVADAKQAAAFKDSPKM